MNMPAGPSTVSPARLHRTGTEILRAVGVPAADAELIAESLVAADRRGIHSHGVMRLPLYVRAVQAGGMVADAPMTWVRSHGATAVLDAGNGFGQVAMGHAVRKARELAATFGTAVVAVRNSSHYGAGAFWTSQLTGEGLAAMLVSTTGASVTPFGAAEKLLGTNPLTLGFPTGSGEPVLLDMASSAGAYGRIVGAAREGESIPDGWAVDAEGRPTTDASAALDGGYLLPFGGHKGSGLAVLLELLAGPLAGGNLASETTDMWAEPSLPMGTGHLLWVTDPAGLQGDDLPLRRAAGFQQALRNAVPAHGADEVLSPGDLEQRTAQRNADGIPLPAATINELEALAAELGTEAVLESAESRGK